MKTILYSLIVLVAAVAFSGCETGSRSEHHDHTGVASTRTAGNGPPTH